MNLWEFDFSSFYSLWANLCFIILISLRLKLGLKFEQITKFQQDQGSQVAPQGCKISPCKSIELNFAILNEVALVETYQI